MIFSICEIICSLILAGMMGVLCGLFSYFLDYCFWKGNIFSWYLPWLAMVNLKKRKPVVFQQIKAMRADGFGIDWQEQATSMAEELPMYKLFGGCAVCLNIWIAVLSWVVFCLITPFSWYYGFSYVLLSSWMIRKLVKAEY